LSRKFRRNSRHATWTPGRKSNCLKEWGSQGERKDGEAKAPEFLNSKNDEIE
jgi:hypothetical protein